MSNNTSVYGSQTPQIDKLAIEILAPAEPSHAIDSFLTSDQTKEVRSLKAS